MLTAVLVLALVLLGGGGGGLSLTDLSGQSIGADEVTAGEQLVDQECLTGADADERADCRIVAVVNSAQEYWGSVLADPPYRLAPTTFFDGEVSTACGLATSAVGPFYCPADEGVYLDLGFYDQLRDEFGASGGPFAEAYVIAHEYGHHVQHILGFDRLVGQDRQGPQSGAVRLELQADCFAGVWAAAAEQTGVVSDITDQDITDALSAASAVGDDRIQQRVQGRVIPESFSHGTAEQRQRWFLTGYRTGDPNRCNTFDTNQL